MKRARCDWTEEEVAMLRFWHEQGKSTAEIHALMPDRGFYGIRTKLAHLRALPWTKRDSSKAFQVPPHIHTDHLAHCRAVMEADCRGSPKGCGFPVHDLPPKHRIAA